MKHTRQRTGVQLSGALPGVEMPLLTSAVPLSIAEQSMLTSWRDPPAWDPQSEYEFERSGYGWLLIAVGGRGIRVCVEPTSKPLPTDPVTMDVWL
ncbi:hypothetical protein [Rathayibacter iranicus]|uniref:Uncharacterized protein n=2 Tax=Rathayibacter iranicus TaxID=59737 RepID=A0AAD1AID3_9MICO|nr:hypothetical protein [Rathayibacter iranicus]AZZ56951.1 hypothetical protein C7V51_14475 [Rathayibacter iranicus]MWV29552.1 hypothetical protein [Rathayibacter iranicus NCPPB 2253 = VKM Ac-1602]PPI41875.1 hypothetical protein C5E09_13330 [Rathayibacter iranicus]PPI57615.1 hypothetical protein C5E08_14230 [Rathayibacter iranicus]PPI68595.1 hypothetical protein C5E01_13285 [Rathayibacter iranicus]